MAIADTIVCIDCGVTCHRIPLQPPELGWQQDDLLTYRCSDCLDVWYLEVHEDMSGTHLSIVAREPVEWLKGSGTGDYTTSPAARDRLRSRA